MELIERTIDPEGRVLLPKPWREAHGRDVMLLEMQDYIRIIPVKKKKLSDLFGKIKVDLEADLADWEAVKKEVFGNG